MSSVVRSFGVKQEGLTRFVKAESPCYNVSDDVEEIFNRLFPFELNNGVLDITYNGNIFKARMVDINAKPPLDETSTAIRILGGPRMVTDLGSNFKDYIRAWRRSTIAIDSPITLYQPSYVMRVQEADTNSVSASYDDSYLISTSEPVSDNYISGDITNNYRVTYVFKTPLTFTIKEGVTTKYITFRTILDQE